MKRKIGFRAWDPKRKIMGQVACLSLGNLVSLVETAGVSFIAEHLMQDTGLEDKNGKWVYEGDIRREEIETNDGDITHYFVMTWIHEWSMFAWLSHTDGEYHKYLEVGAEALDTTMYWCYPADQDEGNKFVVCGNIFEHPHILER